MHEDDAPAGLTPHQLAAGWLRYAWRPLSLDVLRRQAHQALVYLDAMQAGQRGRYLRVDRPTRLAAYIDLRLRGHSAQDAGAMTAEIARGRSSRRARRILTALCRRFGRGARGRAV
jgi:hypothetical protein